MTRPVEAVVLDLGETLVDETAVWGWWADQLAVPRLTFFGALGAIVAERRAHLDVFALVRPDLTLDDVAALAGGVLESGRTVRAEDLYPDALPTLTALREAGYRTAVMANQPSTVDAFLASLPVDQCGSSQSWGVAKPDPAFFARVAEELALPPERVAYVGDRVDNDVLPAKAAGMLAVHLRRGPWGVVHATWPEVAAADVRLETLADLPEALSRCATTPTGSRPSA